MCFLVQASEGIWKPIVDRIRRTIGDSTVVVLLPRNIGIVGAGREVAKDNSQHPMYVCLCFDSRMNVSGQIKFKTSAASRERDQDPSLCQHEFRA
ncbi:dehydration-responsive element-binding protein 3-like [Dorcoceras hygrometricum]|uniref:Dehydration-responsive element-binding protein 3-like n=1 Tax=Dorcoceras hygrometricum TaxID=472368 RepID=A0A2Z7DDU3_9LAMI|nr:dehydration-responsive element-binding protein 3-like [Dorcoceras hygrometricum]